MIFLGCTKFYELQDVIVSRQMKSDVMPSASWYLLLPIIAIVLIVSAVIGILCFWHYSCIRREEINLYINPQHDDSDCPKSIDFDIIDNVIEKTIDHGNSSCDDIVLLYTNHSTSFMTLMKDFRETLTKICSCSVSFAVIIVDNIFYITHHVTSFITIYKIIKVFAFV